MHRNNESEKLKEQVFGNLSKKNLTNMLIYELIENYGYSDKKSIAKMLVQRFLEIIDDVMPRIDRVKPGQIVWLAVDVNDPPARGKTLEQTRLKPVILTLITENDLLKIKKGSELKDIHEEIIARIMYEAYDQGTVLSQYDIMAIISENQAYVSLKIRSWQAKHGKYLPSRGSIHDLGSTLTHKKEIINLYLKGYDTSEISRKMDHHPENVDRYIKVFKRVLGLYEEGKTIEEIAFYIRISKRLVKEYICLIEGKNNEVEK